MGGIAGAIDLTGQRGVPAGILRRMGDALRHRGPDEEDLFERPGLGLIARRRRVAGTETGSPGATNEDRSVFAVFDGQLFDHLEIRTDLQRRDHCLSGSGDSELLPHLWEEHGRQMFSRLRGQFALALWDDRRRRLFLGRDRFGVCPLHWTRQGDWLLFASEIKALLASGMVEARADLRGIAQVFTFFGLPGPVTCFQGVSSLLPGHYLDIKAARGAAGKMRTGPDLLRDNGTRTASSKPPSPVFAAQVQDCAYWELDFPDCGQEVVGKDQMGLVLEYEDVLLRAVQRRLRADVPLAAYSSGGLDSSLLLAMARRLRGEPMTAFTFAVEHPTLEESAGAEVAARHVGCQPNLVQCHPADLLGVYPRLVQAAEGPVIDASAAALFLLAEAVRDRGYGAVLTGEGADEWQAGYPWFRIDKQLNFFNLLLPAGRWGFWAYCCLVGSQIYPRSVIHGAQRAVGGHNAWLLAYHLMSTGKRRFFSREMLDAVGDYVPFDDLQLNLNRIRRWHPLHRSIFMGARVHLPGLHLLARGDRSAMQASVEARYPFLDEDVFSFLARLHPRWKLRGFQDKYLQRLLADRWLPPQLTRNRKSLLHAPLQAFHEAPVPPLIEDLLSERELRRTGYFDPQAVDYWRQRVRGMRHGHRRLFVEMGLVGVISTQLWHYHYLDGHAAELRSMPSRNTVLA